jgi:hypothetical protein
VVNYTSCLVLFISFAVAASFLCAKPASMGGKLKAQFRVEMFNILNNTNLTAQLQTIFDGTGKLIPSVGTPVGPTANTSRQMQLELRLLF